MKEWCCQFGPEQRLAGIITEPSEREPRSALLLISAGLLPKFGPFRLYALLARRLSQLGVACLRFDLGGLGDSLQELSAAPLSARTARDVSAALDYLSQRYAVQRIVLGGLCSGAEDAFRVAAADPRVTGVLLIDPFAYRTRGWAWRHLAHRLARRTLRALGLYQPILLSQAAQPSKFVRYEHMPQQESTRLLAALLARNVRVHFVYTAGMLEHFNHARQLRRAFPDLDFKGLVTLDHFPQLSHTQLLKADRAELVEAIARRLAPAG